MSAEIVTLEDVAGWVGDLAASRARSLSAHDKEQMASVWFDRLRVFQRHHVARAIRDLCATEGRMPGLAEVLNESRKRAGAAARAARRDLGDRSCERCGSAYYPAGFLTGQGDIVLRDRCACPEYDEPYIPSPTSPAKTVIPEGGYNRWNDPRVVAWNVGRGGAAI